MSQERGGAWAFRDRPDYDVLVKNALDEIGDWTRTDVVTCARSLVKLPWIQDAIAGGETKVLGLFRLRAGEGSDRYWPAVMLEVVRPASDWQDERRALVAVFRTPLDDGSPGPWRVAVMSGVPAWKLFIGNADGPPSVVNGDEPARSQPPKEDAVGNVGVEVDRDTPQRQPVLPSPRAVW